MTENGKGQNISPDLSSLLVIHYELIQRVETGVYVVADGAEFGLV